ncbi:MAG: MFS transporter, partial [Proteobacteria bacterium]|nr:MFS transporter [Pseudomonadota bacterium]
MSFSRYLQLLRHPELGAAIAYSFIGRLPIGLTGLAILLFVQTRTASFAEAGIAAAAYLTGLAIASPILGRLIDRLGPRRVMLACAVLYPAFLLALIATLLTPVGSFWAIVFSALAGAALPPVTICMRTLYRRRLGDEALLHTALSLDSVIIEVVFIAGPMAVAFVVAAVAPWAAVALGAITGTVGTLLFMRSPAMKAWRVPLRPTGGVAATLMT